MNTKPSIEIALSTFNGEKYLRSQIDSIVTQTFTDWRLIIRDDGSSDSTIDILASYTKKYPERIFIVESDGSNVGPSQSFSRILGNTVADYIMFSDQDDIWLPDKIIKTYHKMEDLETRHGIKTPLLVFTDVSVTDANLNILSKSLWQYQKSDPNKGRRLNRLLLMTPANGCSIMVNRALLKRALPIHQKAIMHDIWIALVAAAFGVIDYLNEPTLLYRLHGSNESGARPWGPRYVFRQLLDLRSAKQAIAKTQSQANAFYERYCNDLKDDDKKILMAYAHLSEHNFLRRRLDIIKYGIFYVGMARNIGWLLMC